MELCLIWAQEEQKNMAYSFAVVFVPGSIAPVCIRSCILFQRTRSIFVPDVYESIHLYVYLRAGFEEKKKDEEEYVYAAAEKTDDDFPQLAILASAETRNVWYVCLSVRHDAILFSRHSLVR